MYKLVVAKFQRKPKSTKAKQLQAKNKAASHHTVRSAKFHRGHGKKK